MLLVLHCLALHFSLLCRIQQLTFGCSFSGPDRRAELRETACISLFAGLVESITIANMMNMNNRNGGCKWDGLGLAVVLICLAVLILAFCKSFIRFRRDCIGSSARAGQARKKVRTSYRRKFSWTGFVLCLNLVSAHACGEIQTVTQQLSNHRLQSQVDTDAEGNMMQDNQPDLSSDGMSMVQHSACVNDKELVQIGGDTVLYRERAGDTNTPQGDRHPVEADKSSRLGFDGPGMPGFGGFTCHEELHENWALIQNVSGYHDDDDSPMADDEGEVCALPEAKHLFEADSAYPPSPASVAACCPLKSVGLRQPEATLSFGRFCRRACTKPWQC